MFGNGLLDFNDALFCLTGCLLMPFALWTAVMITVRYPRWGGVAFGAVLGGAAYLLLGFLFGDVFGVVSGIVVFSWIVFTQRTMVIKTSQSMGQVVNFSFGDNPFEQRRKPPKIEIISPDEQDRSPF